LRRESLLRRNSRTVFGWAAGWVVALDEVVGGAAGEDFGVAGIRDTKALVTLTLLRTTPFGLAFARRRDQGVAGRVLTGGVQGDGFLAGK
jgi:hypothetical protein